MTTLTHLLAFGAGFGLGVCVVLWALHEHVERESRPR